MPMVVVENADPAAFGGDVHAVTAGVVGQHVGSFADCLVVNHVPVGQVHCDHGGVGFTADEHHLVGGVESLTVKLTGSMTARSLRPCTAATILSRAAS